MGKMQWNWQCDTCGFSGESAARNFPGKCPCCGRSINWKSPASEPPPPLSAGNGGQNQAHFEDSFEKFKVKTDETLRNAFEFEKIEGFSFSKFMRQVFKKHSWAETEDYLSYGTPLQTPELSAISASWPAPWLFFRMILLTVGMVLFLYWQGDTLGVYTLVPLLFFGVIGIPVATLMLFWEVNIPKNISILLLIRIMLISGFLSIIFTLILNGYIKLPNEPIYAVFAGPIEETAKLLTMLFFLRNKKYCYKLNGLLIGAAVGTGFAFIESGGYVIRSGSAADQVMWLRAFCAPVGHIAYSALVGFGLWRVCPGNVFKFENLLNRKFLSLFISAVALHMLWNSPLLTEQIILRTAIIGVIEYTLIIYLIQEGINEIRNLKK